MSDRPLGIRDLIEEHPETGSPEFGMHWYWCRRHEQAHKVGEKCKVECDCNHALKPEQHRPNCATRPWNWQDCIDVGPFMSEREATRLNGEDVIADDCAFKPLGMEVE